MDIQKQQETFIQLCMTQERYQNRFDSRYVVRKNNAVYTEIHMMCKEMFSESTDLAKQVLLPLMEHSNITVRSKAAVYCLYGRVHTDAALELLQQIADDESENKFRRFELQMVIREYRAGNLQAF